LAYDGGNRREKSCLALAEDLSKIRTADGMSDFKIIAGNASFACHKVVLASRCLDVFLTLFWEGGG
jgi:hypothetical protein